MDPNQNIDQGVGEQNPMNPNPVPPTPPMPQPNFQNLEQAPVVPNNNPVNQNPYANQTPPQPNPQAAFESPSGKNKKVKVLMISVAVLIFLMLSTIGVGALVAYEKIPASVAVQKRVSDVVFSVPFFPKTPRYVLTSFWESRSEIKNLEYDASVAVQGLSLPEPWSSFPLEMSANGSFNFLDENNPMYYTHLNLANQFDFEMRSIGSKNYYKLNKLPTAIIGLLGFSTTTPLSTVLDIWVEADNTFLNTDARKSLMEQSDEESYIDEKFEELALAMLNEDILPVTTMEKEEVNGLNTYKLTAEIGPKEFKSILDKAAEAAKEDLEKEVSAYSDVDTDDIQEEIPEYFDNMRISVWIDDVDYRLAKFEIYTKFKFEERESRSASNIYTPELFGSTQNMEILISVSLSNYDGNIVVSPPEDAMSLEEYMVLVNQLFYSFSPTDNDSFENPSVINPEGQLQSTKDAGRAAAITQMAHALEAYYVTHNGSYPLSVPIWGTILVEAGELSSVPAQITYSGETKACTKNAVNSTYCYDKNNSDNFIVYSAMESDTSREKCGSNELTWYVYSSTEGRGGYVCTSGSEPAPGKQTFAI